MIFMKLLDVQRDESLYRVVKRSRQDCLTKSKQVTPALFKDDGGVSVDRDGGRKEEEIIEFIVTESFPKRAKGVVVVSSACCMDVNADVKPAPSKSNPFHANIILSENEQKSKVQALKIADSSQLIYFDKKMEWVNS